MPAMPPYASPVAPSLVIQVIFANDFVGGSAIHPTLIGELVGQALEAIQQGEADQFRYGIQGEGARPPLLFFLRRLREGQWELDAEEHTIGA